jgi:hypothetical protein
MLAIHERILCVAALGVAVCGCSRRQSTTSTTTAPTTQSTQTSQDWHRYDDPRFSAKKRQAVRAASEAVLDPKGPRPDFDQAFRYSVSKYIGDWVVTVWHVYGFKDGNPQFVPDGDTLVILDNDFKVKSTVGGG